MQSFLNSFIIDYFIRQKVSSNINKKYLLELRVPRLKSTDPNFKKLVKYSAKLTCIGKEFNELADKIGIPRGGIKDQKRRWQLQAEIDAIVAQAYGLTKEEYGHVLSTFTRGNNQERLQTLKELSMKYFLEEDGDQLKEAN